ncbi:MAG: orotidine 5'-phosphate decarboxylase [Ignisphaera sp.]|nr:orotidine 5'-phosphate decarboxylase [Ignisphaera sp.]MCX8167888.1 orotidine 5'-phosphate decarboxylase [Ignisphaera sp.]MDW8085471.1 orotidine 5'-phosphate decarboxylase / HUMPS family protein [Ignisphaera sp.]
MAKLFEEASRRPLLQIALDFTDLKQALDVASKVVSAGVHVIELGTPLIKSYGLQALAALKDVVKEQIIVADLKTIDAIELEFTPFAKHGAHAATLLSFVDEDVLEDAVSLCRELNIDLIVDLIHQQNPVEKASRFADIGVGIVSVHVGIDVQRKRGISAKQLLKEVEEIGGTGIMVAVAGGIKPKDVGLFIEHGARIVIIGSAVTRHENPYQAAIEALKGLRTTPT